MKIEIKITKNECNFDKKCTFLEYVFILYYAQL